MRRALVSLSCSVLVLGGLATVPPAAVAAPVVAAAPQPGKKPTFSVLVFSKTSGFRHDSIPAGIEAITQLGVQNGFAVTATEDATRFNDRDLGRFAAVVFLSTTGDVLNADQQSAFERYIGAGGGYVGIHSAADTGPRCSRSSAAAASGRWADRSTTTTPP